MKSIKVILSLLVLASLVGCNQDSMAAQEKETLKGNLNKPVDVEKIRADYNKNKPAETGPKAATDGM
ncbi:MAG: hypothetical protein ACOYON_05730 [Fimbriimonas sp.]